ncbi:hypothetical protein EFS57_09430 [Leuconostoc falkenbergense]|nr:hypothetical protein [Leuconostoc falkenbergense]
MLVYYVIIVNYFLLVNTNLQLIIRNLLSFKKKEEIKMIEIKGYGMFTANEVQEEFESQFGYVTESVEEMADELSVVGVA